MVLFVIYYFLFIYADRGANISALNAEGCSPLHDAVLREDTDISTELLKAGADLHLSAVEGY